MTSNFEKKIPSLQYPVSFDRCTLKTKENSDSRLWSLWNMLLVPIKVSWFRNVVDCTTYSNYEKRIITKNLPSGAFFTRMAGLNVSDLSNLQRKIHILQDALINFNMVWNRAWNNDLFLHAKNESTQCNSKTKKSSYLPISFLTFSYSFFLNAIHTK